MFSLVKMPETSADEDQMFACRSAAALIHQDSSGNSNAVISRAQENTCNWIIAANTHFTADC